MAGTQQVSATAVVDAPPEKVFDVLADPAQHAAIDGSGTVQRTRGDAPARLFEGAKFGMAMKMGVPYPITNTVVEFEEGRRIGWRHMGRHVWRYELEPVDGGARTQVTETFDWGPALAGRLYPVIGVPKKNLAAMEATLERLAAYVAPSGADDGAASDGSDEGGSDEGGSDEGGS